MNADFFLLDLINTTLRVLVTIIAAFALYEFFEDYKPVERIGLGFMASGSFMTVPPIWSYHPGQGVYDSWAVTVMTLGIALMIVGRIVRHVRHRINNARHVDGMARELREIRRKREKGISHGRH